MPNQLPPVRGEPLVDAAEEIIATIVNQGDNDGNSEPAIKIPVQIPSGYFLAQPHPNPFNAVTKLSFGLPEASHVTIGVYDMSGRLVAQLMDAELEAGHHTAVWDAVSVPNSVYLIRMEAAKFNVVRKAILMR